VRKLRVFESLSLDGYFTDGAGSMDWAHAPPDPEFGAWVAANASGGSDLLFGRVTYQLMESFWTSAQAARQMPEVARGMNAARKHVASRTLRPRWSNAALLEGELVEAVRALKRSEGPSITLLGSGTIAALLGAAGLVDEYQLVYVPVALGGGRTIFSAGQRLALLEARSFPGNGNVVLTYAAR
jgi:dihydrofolate reductase